MKKSKINASSHKGNHEWLAQCLIVMDFKTLLYKIITGSNYEKMDLSKVQSSVDTCALYRNEHAMYVFGRNSIRKK